jgi:hypothetical protein
MEKRVKTSRPTTTRQRIDLLSRAYPRLFPRVQLMRLVREQLGDVNALDRWISRGSTRVRARAPRLIYHVCAGNLAISAITSIAHGLLVGAHNTVKLPSPREDDVTRREIVAHVRGLPRSLRELVHLQSTRDENALQRADVVIAFGSDATMTALRARLRSDQKFIAHGHAVSLLWVGEPHRFTTQDARACAIDILTYDQLGCLSPQALYLPLGTDLESFGTKLSLSLETQWRRLPAKSSRPLGVRARIAEARDVARALGHQLWLPPSGHLGWTLIDDPDPTFAASPLHGVISIRRSPLTKLGKNLAPVRGRISTVGVACTASSSPWRETFLKLGVSRFCRAGRMQFPPLSWHHDGRVPLSELVTWVDDETAS